MIALIALATSLMAGPERDNHKGVQAWAGKDTAAALKAFERAARKDSARADYAFNLGTAKTLSGKDGEAELSRAVTLSKTPDEKARALYNRGTARLAKALAAPQGKGDPSGAISDLREALKIRPKWNEAARNLDRALRMRPPPNPKQCPNPKNQNQPNDPKQDKKDQEPQDPKQDPKDSQQQQQQQQPQGMDPRDAQRLLDGAAARENQQARERARQKKEDSDAPDW